MPDRGIPIAVAEMPDFARRAERLWSNDEREEFIDFIALNPEAGSLIERTGGVRKIRWGRAGQGKRGGVRVIYYYHDDNLPLLLMTLFAKNERDDLGEADKRDLHAFTRAYKTVAKEMRK